MNKRFSFFVSRSLFMIMLIFSGVGTFAQDKKVEMADVMRGNGKIYTVVAVCLTILIGLFIYVFSIDNKLRRLEKATKSENL